MKSKQKKIFFLSIGIYFLIAYQISAIPDSVFVDDEEFYVDSVLIVGNDITEDFIILRELTFQPGDTVRSSDLLYNRERVFSLRLFNRVSIYPVFRGMHTIIYIDVKEGWYIYPVPFIKRQDKSSNKYSYGINVTYKNFRGRDEILRALISLGYDPYFLIAFENPAVDFENGIGLGFNLSYLKSYNKNSLARSVYGGDFQNKFYTIGTLLKKRLNQFNTIFGVGSFQYIETPGNLFPGFSASGEKIDRTISLGIGYLYDSRDLKQFSQDGVYSLIELVHKGLGINDISYNVLNFDFREYRPFVDGLVAKWRIAFRHTFGGLIPFYDYSYLGYDEYVRGHADDNREGNNFVISSLEFSYPVLKEFDFSIKLPLLPQQLTSARIGIFITAFADAGHAFNNHQRFRLGDLYSGYGVGITFLVLPYNAIRFEYAIGHKKSKGEFLIGTGFSF